MSLDFMMDYDKFKRTWSVKTELPVEFKLTYSADNRSIFWCSQDEL